MFLKSLKNIDKEKACQAMLIVVAKRKSMLDKENSKCLSSNACTFGRGFIERQIFLKFQVLVYFILTGAIDDQSFEFSLDNFAGLTNITSIFASLFSDCICFTRFLSYACSKLRVWKIFEHLHSA